jgi:hypothetical protein
VDYVEKQQRTSGCTHRAPKLEVRVATWVLLIGEKMVAPDENHFEPPTRVAGEWWPFVVAYAFAFRIMTFVSDHMPLCRSEGHLKTLIQSATR